MSGKLALALSVLGLALLSVPVRSSERTSLLPSSYPNLDAARIASKAAAQAKGQAFLMEKFATALGEMAFKAQFDRQVGPLLAEATQKVNGGDEVAVVVCEIYTSPYGFTEVGPMTLVTGSSVMAALKQYAATPTISKARTGFTRSYSLMVLSKSNFSAGFTSEVAPDEMVKAAFGAVRAEFQAQAEATRSKAREAARKQAEVAARQARERSRRESDGPRENSRMGEFRGGAESKGKGSESKGAESKSKGADSKGKEGRRDTGSESFRLR